MPDYKQVITAAVMIAMGSMVQETRLTVTANVRETNHRYAVVVGETQSGLKNTQVSLRSIKDPKIIHKI